MSKRSGLANIVVPLVADYLFDSPPQRKAGVKATTEAPSDPTADAMGLIGLGLTCIVIGIVLLSAHQPPSPR